MPHLFERTTAEAYVTGNISSDKAQQLGAILTTLIMVGPARTLQEVLTDQLSQTCTTWAAMHMQAAHDEASSLALALTMVCTACTLPA